MSLLNVVFFNDDDRVKDQILKMEEGVRKSSNFRSIRSSGAWEAKISGIIEKKPELKTILG